MAEPRSKDDCHLRTAVRHSGQAAENVRVKSMDRSLSWGMCMGCPHPRWRPWCSYPTARMCCILYVAEATVHTVYTVPPVGAPSSEGNGLAQLGPNKLFKVTLKLEIDFKLYRMWGQNKLKKQQMQYISALQAHFPMFFSFKDPENFRIYDIKPWTQQDLTMAGKIKLFAEFLTLYYTFVFVLFSVVCDCVICPYVLIA